jgi:hypothetical protein
MKNICTLIFAVLLSISALSQEDCDDLQKGPCCGTEANKIPPLDEIKCKDEKAYLYNLMPKITEYKGCFFREINNCNTSDLDVMHDQIRFEYCMMPETRKRMYVTIIDLEAPFFQTTIGKPQREMYLLLFKLIMPAMNTYNSENKNFDKAFIDMSKAANSHDAYVSFNALKYKRYYVHIQLDYVNRFKKPTDVDSFIEEYTGAFNFGN